MPKMASQLALLSLSGQLHCTNAEADSYQMGFEQYQVSHVLLPTYFQSLFGF